MDMDSMDMSGILWEVLPVKGLLFKGFCQC